MEKKPTHPLSGICFIDIETVKQQNSFTELPESEMNLFHRRHHRKYVFVVMNQTEGQVQQQLMYDENAPLYAEHGKIVCISVGQIKADGKFRMKSFCGRHEKELLEAAFPVFDSTYILAGHNILEFDLPYLFRRYLINGLKVPSSLNIAGKKTWDIPHIDTMKLWSHAAWNYKVSLDLLAHAFGLPSPKEKMSGADVGNMYWGMMEAIGNMSTELPFEREAGTLKIIAEYCEGDVLTGANVYCKLKGLPIILNDQIEHA